MRYSQPRMEKPSHWFLFIQGKLLRARGWAVPLNCAIPHGVLLHKTDTILLAAQTIHLRLEENAAEKGLSLEFDQDSKASAGRALSSPPSEQVGCSLRRRGSW